MSLSEQIQRVDGGQNAALKTILQKLGVTVGDEKIDQYAALAAGISQKLLPENIVSSQTLSAFGLGGDAVPDDVFAAINAMFYMLQNDVAQVMVTVQDESGNPIPSVLVSGIENSSGDAAYTNSSGVATGFAPGGSVTISVSGYGDMQDASETFTATKGTVYNKTLTCQTVDFIKYTSSGSVKFSERVAKIDFSLVGGGGGGAGGWGIGYYQGASPTYGGNGGAGGECVTVTDTPIVPNQAYAFSIGAGGGPGTGDLNTSTQSQTAGKAGGASSFMEHTANGGAGGAQAGQTTPAAGNGNGGVGAYTMIGSSGYYAATSGSSGGTLGYISKTETATYGGGGGGGANVANTNMRTPGSGGADYGAAGSSSSSSPGASASPGTGGGGGGGYMYAEYYENTHRSSNGGSGGSGCLAIRIHFAA